MTGFVLRSRRLLLATLVVAHAGPVTAAALAETAASEDPLTAAAAAVASRDLPTALDRLRQSFGAGYPTPSDVLADSRFSALREDAVARHEWRRLMGQFVLESEITMVTSEEPGVPMLVLGRVVSSPRGTPIVGAILEIYHTDNSGRYEPSGSVGDDANSRLFAFVSTDEEGRFSLRSIKPAPYPGSSWGAAHVHFRVRAAGYRSYSADFRPYDNPTDPDERASSVERGWRYSTVRQQGDLLIVEVTIPMRATQGEGVSFTSKLPENPEGWSAVLQRQLVECVKKDFVERRVLRFPRESFEVDGHLPAPAG